MRNCAAHADVPHTDAVGSCTHLCQHVLHHMGPPNMDGQVARQSWVASSLEECLQGLSHEAAQKGSALVRSLPRSPSTSPSASQHCCSWACSTQGLACWPPASMAAWVEGTMLPSSSSSAEA